jgi:hypothetical protein
MAKAGKQKNTKNKAKHSKLMERKKKKLREDKVSRKERLRAVLDLSRAEKIPENK